MGNKDWGNDYCLASNITLVNAFDGIIFSRRSGGGAPNCYGIYGATLRLGIEIDNIAEVGRIDNVDFRLITGQERACQDHLLGMALIKSTFAIMAQQ